MANQIRMTPDQIDERACQPVPCRGGYREWRHQ